MDTDKYLRRMMKGFPRLEKSWTREVITPPTYRKGMIPLGIDTKGQTFYFDTTIPAHACTIALTRSGKSWLNLGKWSQGKEIGEHLIVLLDPKNELSWAKQPLQPEFRSMLARGDQPKGMKMRVFRPKFFQDDKLPPFNDDFISLSFHDLTKSDWYVLTDYDARSAGLKNRLDIIYDWIAKRKANNIDDILDKLQELEGEESESIVLLLHALSTQNIFEEEYSQDLVQWMNEGYAIVINCDGYDKFGEFGGMALQNLLSVLVTKLVDAKRNGKLKGMLRIGNPEASVTIPKDKNTPLKRVLLKTARIDTGRGISIDNEFQIPNAVDEEILQNSRFIFLPYNMETDILGSFLKKAGIIRHAGYDSQLLLNIKRQLKQYYWLVIDKSTQKWAIIKPYAPKAYLKPSQV